MTNQKPMTSNFFMYYSNFKSIKCIILVDIGNTLIKKRKLMYFLCTIFCSIFYEVLSSKHTFFYSCYKYQISTFIIYRKLIVNKSSLNESATQSVRSPTSLKVSY